MRHENVGAHSSARPPSFLGPGGARELVLERPELLLNVPLAHWLNTQRERFFDRHLVRSLLWVLGGFLIACPYALLDLPHFLDDVATEIVPDSKHKQGRWSRTWRSPNGVIAEQAGPWPCAATGSTGMCSKDAVPPGVRIPSAPDRIPHAPTRFETAA